MTFTDFSLNESIQNAVLSMGFITPTPIQEAVIPALLEDSKDIVALAQTGTGKTAAFGLPILEKLRGTPPEIGALVLCPTRELAIQITKELQLYAGNLPQFDIDVVYGGAGYGEQIRSLRQGVHILVATPGRLLDLINKGKVDLHSLKYLVLDEADIMLNMGFKDELDAILESVPVHRRSILLSATMPREVERIAANYMDDPHTITMGKRNAAARSVDHSYFLVRGNEKYAALKRLVDFHPDIYGIVFCRTKISTQKIAEQLIHDGYNAEALHGDLSQSQREVVMNKFRNKNLQLLIATDIAARGLDVQDLSHVIHYDLPDEIEMYTHRSGRTGRAGKSGNSYAIVGVREKRRLQHIERSIDHTIEEGLVPKEKDIIHSRLLRFADQIAETETDEEKIAAYLPALREKLSHLDKDELLQQIISMQFNRLLEYYHELPDMKPVSKQDGQDKNSSSKTLARRDKSKKRSGRNNANDKKKYGKKHKQWDDTRYTNISINLGKRDSVAPPNLIGLVNQTTRNRDINIGNIKIDTSWSNVQIEKDYAPEVVEALSGFTYEGRTVKAHLGKKTKQNR